MNGLLKQLDRHFELLRDKIALRDDPAQPGITYGRLDELSGRIYGYLKEKGIGREDTVLLCLPRGLQFPVAMAGVWRAGAAFVVCEDTYAPERIAYIKNDCACRLVIDRDNWAEILSHDYLAGRETVQPHDLAYSVYTSGTTGNPKGVLHEFGNLDESCAFKNLDGVRLVETSDVLALNAPLNFVAAQDYINNVFFSGATLFVVAYSYVKNPAALIELYEAAGITCTFMTPSGFRVLRSVNPQMRWMVLGGVPCEEVPITKAGAAMGWLMALLFLNMEDGIYLSLNYTSTRYHKATMERFCEECRRIAAALASAGPETPVRSLLE